MQRWFRVVLLQTLALLFGAMPLSAQVEFGITGGLQMVSLDFSADGFEKSNRFGFFVGPQLDIETPILGLGVEVAALYDQRDFKVNDHTVRQKSLVIPVNGRLGTYLFDTVAAFLMAGPQLSFNIGPTTDQWTNAKKVKQQYIFESSTFSLNFGFGVRVKHLEGTIVYNVPIGKSGDVMWGTSLEHSKMSANAWRLGVTYYL